MKVTIRPSGLNQDINPAELPPDVWNAGSNVVFNSGFAAAAPGWKESSPGLLCKPVWLLPILDGQIYYWLYAGNNDTDTAGLIGVTDGTAHWDITPIGGIPTSAAGDWTGGALNGIPVFNSQFHAPLTWDKNTANAATVLPGWPALTRCAALRPFKYHLIAMNISDGAGEFPDLVLWSSAADPGALPASWTPQPDNDAGSFSLAATAGAIVDGGAMRDQFMVYKEHSSSIMQYIAGQFVFSNRKAFVTSGILARNCWAELYGQHYVLTDGDFIRHNGQEVISLIDGVNREWLFNQIDADFYTTAHIVLSHDQKTVWINWPKQGHSQADTALVFDIVSSSYGVVDFDEDIAYMTRGILNDPAAEVAFDDRTDTFDLAIDRFNTQAFNPTTDILVFCRTEDKKMFGMGGFLRDGATVPVFLQMLSKDLGKPQQRKLVQAVWPQADLQGAPGTVQVRVGTQAKIVDPISWTQPSELVDDLRTTMMASGRFISLEITGQQESDWRLNSVDIDYTLQGMW